MATSPFGKKISELDSASNVNDTVFPGVQGGINKKFASSILLNRTNHTGEQAISTITDLQSTIDDINADIADGVVDANTKLVKTNNLSDLTDVSAALTNLGLENVDNTADTDKPVSTATQTALDGKQDLDSNLTAIAALTTTTFGRNALTDADEASFKSRVNLEIGTDVQAHSTILDNTTASFTTAQQTKLTGIETGADVTDATNVDAAGAVMNTDSTTASMSFVVDEDAMTSNSATKVPTQQSVKAYADTKLAKESNLSDLDNASSARSNLGLGSIATQSSSSVSITGGSISGITDLAIADGGTGASSASSARSNLGLGTSATVNTGTSGATIPLLNAGNTWSANQTFNNQLLLGSSALTTFWSASAPPFVLPYGYIGSNGAFAIGMYSNGYRNSSGTWTSLGVNGETGASAIEVLPTGSINFRAASSVPSGNTPTSRGSITADGTWTINTLSAGTINGTTPGTKGLSVLGASNTAGLTTALTGAVADDSVAATSNLYNRINDMPSIKDYGAVGDAVLLTDGVATASDATFTSATANFTSADIGKPIAVFTDATGVGPEFTTIASINSTTSVELTDALTTSKTSCRFVYGTDDTTAFQNALDDQIKIFVPEGGYVVTDEIVYSNGSGLIGVGNWTAQTTVLDQQTATSTLYYLGTGGTNSCVVRISDEAVGVDATNAATRNMTNVSMVGITVDACELAEIGIYMVRAFGSGNVLNNLTVTHSLKHGFLLFLCFVGAPMNWVAHNNVGRGFTLGDDTLYAGWVAYNVDQNVFINCWAVRSGCNVYNAYQNVFDDSTATDKECGVYIGASRGLSFSNFQANSCGGPAIYFNVHNEANAAGPTTFMNGYMENCGLSSNSSLDYIIWQTGPTSAYNQYNKIEGMHLGGTPAIKIAGTAPSRREGGLVLERMDLLGTIDAEHSSFQVIDCDPNVTYSDQEPDGYAYNINGHDVFVHGDEGVVNTYSPVISGSTTAGTQTYTIQIGRWYMTGKMCTIDFRIVLSAVGGTSAGSVQMSLPSGIQAATVSNMLWSGTMSEWVLASAIMPTPQIASGDNVIIFKKWTSALTSNTNNVGITDLTNSSRLTGSITFEVA